MVVPDIPYGHLTPVTDVDLNLTNANVLFTIYAKNPKSIIFVNFKGTYTVFNSDNTTSVKIAIKIANSYTIVNDTLFVFENNTSIKYELEREPPQYKVWAFADWLGFNMTFPSNNYTTLTVQFNSIIDTSDLKFVDFSYDVESASLWAGNISETVEYIVFGKEPTSYTQVGGHSSDFSLLIQEDYTSYKWKWTNERIDESFVGIAYSTSKVLRLVFPIASSFLIYVVVIINIVRKLKKKTLIR